MTEDFEEQAEPPPGVGAQLRAAREARGLTLAEVAAETRIPQRHLVTIEAGEFAALPARTYAVGFAKTYAKAVGLDDGDVAELVRAELDAQDPRPRHRAAGFEPGDPARVPSRALGWFSIFAVGLILAGLFFAFRTYFAPAAELPALVAEEQAAPGGTRPQAPVGAQGATAVARDGAVVFTALDERVWVKFYDAAGNQLMQKEMARGERYTVPPDAAGPQLWTGRPDALAITVGGRAVPKLAAEERIMRDVPVTAAALLARGREAARPAPSPTT